ncbi:hypothetical protein ACJJTC_011865 [Scirpophaga incertulas]
MTEGKTVLLVLQGERRVRRPASIAGVLGRQRVPVRVSERAQQSGGGISAGRNQRFVPWPSHSHVNNYRRVSNYKAPLRPADTYSSDVRAARDSFLRAVGWPSLCRASIRPTNSDLKQNMSASLRLIKTNLSRLD